MATNHIEEVGVNNLSILNYHNKSATGAIGNWLGFSVTGGAGFNDRWSLPATTVDVGVVRDVLITLLKTLGKPPA